MISVIVPACNEGAVIGRGLRAILTGANAGELEVIVACNGCTDRTAEIARGFGPPVQVIELAQASKIAALNAADELATGFPRLYVDADVALDLASIRAMAAALARDDVRFATPSLHVNSVRASWPVRAFYRVWVELPYNRAGGQVGTGVYGLSRAGRARFKRFPNVINDDGFVRSTFAQHERMTVAGAISRVDPPQTLAGLIRAKRRVRIGQDQLRKCHPEIRIGGRRANSQSLWRWVLRRPELWVYLPVYACIVLATRLRTGFGGRADGVDWGRDDSRGDAADSPQPPAL